MPLVKNTQSTTKATKRRSSMMDQQQQRRSSIRNSLKRTSKYVAASIHHHKPVRDVSYDLDDTESKVQYILNQLTSEELEIAARSSYDYVRNPVDRNIHASLIVERYLESKKGNVEVALEKVKATLKFRKTIGMDSLITAFDDDDSDTDGESNPNTVPLEKQLASKKMFVQGYDKDGRSTLMFIPRKVQGHHEEWTLKEAVYSIERAIACSKAKDHTINAVIDFSEFSLFKHAPPTSIGKQFMTTLRSHYAGQIHGIYLLDPPPAFAILWKIFSPFVGTNTRDKIHIISGKDNKTRTFEKIYEPNQVPSWMMSSGTKNRELDLQEYLYGTNFFKSFDDGDDSCDVVSS